MLQLNVNPHIANQTVVLSDSTLGELSGIRVPQPFPKGPTIQWTFIDPEHEHEGFVYTGGFNEGQVIKSMNGNDEYKIHFTE